MKKDKRNNDHPEINNLKNICEVSPEAKTTKNVCEKIKKRKKFPDRA